MIVSRLAIVHAGGIGDFLCTLPAIRKQPPGRTIDLIGDPQRLQLAVDAGLARRALSTRETGFDSLFGEPDDRARAYFGRMQAALVWMRDEDGRLRQALSSLGIRDVHCHPGLPPDDWPRHAADYYAERSGLDPCYEGTEDRLLDAAGPLLPLQGRCGWDVAIHTGSGSAAKNWPMDRFQAVAEALRSVGRKVAWLAGPAEIERGQSAAGAVYEDSLSQLARRLAATRLYIGNDSGITHLAAAVGCPTIAIFGPTNSRRWAPRGGHVRMVQGAPWPAADEVIAAAREFLP